MSILTYPLVGDDWAEHVADGWRGYLTDLPAGVLAATRWSDRTVWVSPRLVDGDRVCCLTYVLEHERQHVLYPWGAAEQARWGSWDPVYERATDARAYLQLSPAGIEPCEHFRRKLANDAAERALELLRRTQPNRK